MTVLTTEHAFVCGIAVQNGEGWTDGRTLPNTCYGTEDRFVRSRGGGKEGGSNGLEEDKKEGTTEE